MFFSSCRVVIFGNVENNEQKKKKKMYMKFVKNWPLIHLPVTIVHSISKAWGIYSGQI